MDALSELVGDAPLSEVMDNNGDEITFYAPAPVPLPHQGDE